MSFVHPPLNFHGFIWEPTSEQDVVVLFGRVLDRLGAPLAIEHTGTVFPDCTVIDTSNARRIYIEFEYRSSSFWIHLMEWHEMRQAHPTARCWVVCWLDDRDERQKSQTDVEVVALRDVVMALDRECDTPLVLNWYDGDRTNAATMFDWRAGGLSSDRRLAIDRVKRFGQTEPGFELRWPLKPDLPSFTLRHMPTELECFKVYANGRISFPFARWHVTATVKGQILSQLNDALRTRWFAGRETRKKGCDISVLLSDNEALDRFLDVWRALSQGI